MSFTEKLKSYLLEDMPKYLGETLEMVFVTSLIALIFGLLLGFVLYFTKNSKNKYSRWTYKILNVFVSIVRSFPFYVLMFFVIPFTRIIMKIFTGVGQAFSTEAFIVPLTLAAIPFFAKLIENSLDETKKEVIEAGVSLGLNTWQITTKIILKESLPSIISGVTLAIITLIGYSAMAGAVGGGGLGFFAYDKGYVAYDATLMIFAVITIIILVLIIQQCGNLLYKMAKVGKLSYAKILAGTLVLVSVFGVTKATIAFSGSNLPKIVVGTMSQPGEPILENLKESLKEKGYQLEIKLFNEFEAVNNALVDKSVDANLFQHEPYLDNYNKANNTDLVKAITMYDCVYGAYTKKDIKSIEDLKNTKDTIYISVANDSSNLKRCIELLEANGIIKTTELFKTSQSLSATDIEKYYKPYPSFNVKLNAMSSAAIAKSLENENTYLGIISATYAINAKLTSNELLFEEKDLEHKNANIVAVRKDDLNEEWLKVLADELTSDNTKTFIEDYFKGTIKPYFIKHF